MKTILKFNSINSFSTKRLVAEKVQDSDLDKFRVMHSNEEVMCTLGGMRNEEQTVDNLNWNLKEWEDNGFGLWMFYLKDDAQQWVGRGGIRIIEIAGRSEIEIGYALMPEFWNRGFATEITEACIEIAFAVLKLNDLICITLTDNKASRRVMEKAGFRYEADVVHAGLAHVLYRIKRNHEG